MVPFCNPSWLPLVPDPPLNEATGIPVILGGHVTDFSFFGQRSTLICTLSKNHRGCFEPNAYVCFLLVYYTFFVFIWHLISGFTQQQRRDYDKITFESLKIRYHTLQHCLCLQTFQNGWFNLAQCVFIVCGVLSFIRFIRFILNCFFE